MSSTIEGPRGLIFGTKDWEVSKVTDMRFLFDFASKWRGPTTYLQHWNVEKVKHFDCMFRFCKMATPNTNEWRTPSALRMNGMFRTAEVAEPVVTEWDVSKLTELHYESL